MFSYQKYQIRYTKLDSINEESCEDYTISEKRKKIPNNLRINSPHINRRPINFILNSPITPKNIKTDFVPRLVDFNDDFQLDEENNNLSKITKCKELNATETIKNIFDSTFTQENKNNKFCPPSFGDPNSNIMANTPIMINKKKTISSFLPTKNIFAIDSSNNNRGNQTPSFSPKLNNNFEMNYSNIINIGNRSPFFLPENNNNVAKDYGNNNYNGIKNSPFLQANNIIAMDYINNKSIGSQSPSFLHSNNFFEKNCGNDKNKANQSPSFLSSNSSFIMNFGNNKSIANESPSFLSFNNSCTMNCDNKNNNNKSPSLFPENNIFQKANPNFDGTQGDRKSKMNNNINFLQKKNSCCISEINRALNIFNISIANNPQNPFNPNKEQFNIPNSKPILNNYRNNRLNKFSDNLFQSYSSLTESEELNGLDSDDLSSISSDNSFFGKENITKIKKILCKYCSKSIRSSYYLRHLTMKHMTKLTNNEAFDCFNHFYKCISKKVCKAKNLYNVLDSKKVAEVDENDNEDNDDLSKKLKIINSFKPVSE